MKKPIVCMLILSILLSLTACADPFEENTPETVADTAADSLLEAVTDDDPADGIGEASSEAPETDPQLGSFEGGIYTNEFLGITCPLNEFWNVASAAEIAQLQGMTLELISDEDLKKQLENSGTSMIFYASADEGLVTMNIVVEKLSLLYSISLDETAYLDLSADALPSALESMGFEDVTLERVRVPFLGNAQDAAHIHGTYSGVDFYELLLPRKVGSYMAILTLGSYLEDITTELAAMYAPI